MSQGQNSSGIGGGDGGAATGAGTGARARAAFLASAGDIAAVPRASIIKVNLDIPTVVQTVTAKYPGIRALLPRMEQELPMFDRERFGKMETYALALFYAHGAYLVAIDPVQSLAALVDEATKLKKLLTGDGMTQEVREIFNPKILAQIQAGSGHRDLAEDLIAFVNLYRSHWQEVQGGTAVSLHHLERAEALAAQLLIGSPDENDPLRPPRMTRSEAIEQRERAFALMVETYNEARNAVIYLRRKEGDADAIAPSLYAGRARPRPSGEPDEATPPPDTVGPTDTTEGGATPNAASEATATRAAKSGMRGSNPYTE